MPSGTGGLTVRSSDCGKTIPQDPVGNEPAIDPDLEHIKSSVEAIEILLGSSVQRPNRWSDLSRHLAFGQMGDLADIVKFDWPAVSGGLQKSLYAPEASTLWRLRNELR